MQGVNARSLKLCSHASYGHATDKDLLDEIDLIHRTYDKKGEVIDGVTK